MNLLLFFLVVFCFALALGPLGGVAAAVILIGVWMLQNS
jgi:hypothetical protein